MKYAVINKIASIIIIALGGIGMTWLSFQENSIFTYFRPISLLSIILFVVGIIRTLLQIMKYGIKTMRFELLIIGAIIIVLLVGRLKEYEIFKSDKVFEAVLIDDLSSINLVLRKNGSFETVICNMYGSDVVTGKYELKGDTLIFHDRPDINEFIPNRILIDKGRQRVWIKKLDNGDFDTTEHFAGYFEVRHSH